MTLRSAIYTGSVMHARFTPLRHRFEYPLCFLVVDLDELPLLAARSMLFRHNAAGVVAIHDSDYQRGPVPGLKSGVVAFAHAAGLEGEIARVELLTHPRIFGYVFNPVSFFYCYDRNDGLLAVVTEINNTYSGRVRHLFDARKRIPSRVGHSYAQSKELYVSPFIAMDAKYHFHFTDERAVDGHVSRREVRADVFENDQQFFVARLQGTPRPIDDRALAWMLLRYPLMTVQVISLIYFEAWRLDRKGVARYPRPGSPAEASR